MYSPATGWLHMESEQLADTGSKVARPSTVVSKEEAMETESHIPVVVAAGNEPAALVCKAAEMDGEAEEDKKREREHKRRSKNWTRMETMKLIKFRTEMEQRFLRSGRKSDLWDEISEKLKREAISRDLQQCRDKWEKLTASYKEVREGAREKVDFVFFDALDPILSGKTHKIGETLVRRVEAEENQLDSDGDEADAVTMTEYDFQAKRRRSSGIETVEALKELLETLIERQQRFFAEVLESIERREKIREKIRRETEEKWREEDRAQSFVFQDAMILLTKRLVAETAGSAAARCPSDSGDGVSGASPPAVTAGGGRLKKRSRNWKRWEIELLIKARRGMEARFAKSTRRGALWEEVAAALRAEGVKRDGKQCRDKWDKLVAELKDVSDGKRGREDCRHFADLIALPSPQTANPTAAVDDLDGPGSPT
ncbi:hypothetical protein H6P81_000321 [Aristolochia fimbriata]|uniref:Myb-like domain-containing protein n=1 Tax=Aristolochia fimbriata TaxID=158543 RepID=A0AAV7F416_ARIFI|nr:hypothetical protein H6P81_000321 [Aristolochia fimbriata]